MKCKIDYVSKKFKGQKKQSKNNQGKDPQSPNSEVNDLITNVEVRKNLLFDQALVLQLKRNAESLQKNTKD